MAASSGEVEVGKSGGLKSLSQDPWSPPGNCCCFFPHHPAATLTPTLRTAMHWWGHDMSPTVPK